MKTASGSMQGSMSCKLFCIVLIIVVCAFLGACGGGGGVQVASSDGSGQFIDAPIAGLEYVCGALSGMTDVNGNFRYTAGTPVTFKVGDIVVGRSSGSDILTPINFSPNSSNADTPSVVQTVRFFLSIADYDAVNDRLNIPNSVSKAAKGKNYVFSNATSAKSEKDMAMVVNQLVRRPLVSADDAKKHLKGSLNKLAAGTYSGEWKTNIDKGSFAVVVARDGSMVGSAALGRTIITVTSNFNSILASGSTYAFTGEGKDAANPAVPVLWSGTIDLARKTISGNAQYGGVPATFSGVRMK